MVNRADYLIIGAGMYGLYAAQFLLRKGRAVELVETEAGPFQRASYVNQARVHNGYHYPRSFATASKSARYFSRFNETFRPAINSEFRQLYGISSRYSLTSGEQFERFCRSMQIPCRQLRNDEYFIPSMVDGVFETVEHAYDAKNLSEFLMQSIRAAGGSFHAHFGQKLKSVETTGGNYRVTLGNGKVLEVPVVLNATYASVNQVNGQFGFESFPIKYEICEIILCRTSTHLASVGLTVMDGPFFSVMPFGRSGMHSLTSVAFTPHTSCREELPRFSCQAQNPECTPQRLSNCNPCVARPPSAYRYMKQIMKKYVRPEVELSYERSLFSIKPVLTGSELDDSRPTLIRVLGEHPKFISVLSGKISTVFDLEEVLE